LLTSSPSSYNHKLGKLRMRHCCAMAESQVALPVTGGVATWTLQLPAAPALIGVSLFQQALALHPNGPNRLAMTPASVSVVGGR
jgi:hypothetical protein